MSNRFELRTGAEARAGAAIDEGLRAYMLRVYNYMTGGLAITGIVAYLTAQLAVVTDPATGQIVGATQFGATLFGSPLVWLVMLAPLGAVFFLGFRIHKLQLSTAQAVFWGFSVLMGLSLATIFIQFTGASIARVFFITAGTFAAMSLYGYTTKKDLTGWGSFLFMGLIGIIIASVVNMFIASSALHFAVSVIGVLVFTGLTAYDTQRIKNVYYEGDSSETEGKKALMGALSLYLDFINLFIMLMRLLGERR
ncbi:MAG: Bax inhibitor-1/YccA family protein [Alphaproteobacteria bacterium]